MCETDREREREREGREGGREGMLIILFISLMCIQGSDSCCYFRGSSMGSGKCILFNYMPLIIPKMF